MRQSPFRKRASNPDRCPGPSETCCWARSRSSQLRSYPSPLDRIDGACAGWGLDTAADVNLGFRMLDDLESGAAEHGLHAGGIRRPPVRGIVGVAMFDEMHLRIARIVEMIRLPKG